MVWPCFAQIAWSDPEKARTDEMLAIDEALELLASRDFAAAELVKLRYFAGLSMEDAASALEIPLRTAERLWTYAKAWLHRSLAASNSGF